MARRVAFAGRCTQTVTLALGFSLVGPFVPAESFAQHAPSQWRPDPARERYLQGQQDPSIGRPDRPAIAVPSLEQPKSVPAASSPSSPAFRLTGVSIYGARSISLDALSAAYSDKVGRRVTLADVSAIAEAITAIYRKAGFHLSRAIIPQQDVNNGVVRIDVVEGRIEDIVVKGTARDTYGIRKVLAPIAAESPSRIKTMERQLLNVNEIPGVLVKDTAIEEIGQMSGRFRLIVTVDTWRIYWAQSLDNFGTGTAGPLQASTGLSFNSTFIAGDTLGVAATTVPDEPSALSFGRLFYDVPVDTHGTRVGFSALQSAVRPTDDRRFWRDATRTTGYELRGSILPLQERHTSLRLTAAFNISDVSETDDGGTWYKDRLRILSLAADYKLKDNLEGWNYFTVIVRQGLKAMGASTQDDMVSVYGASGDFTTVNLVYTRLQKLTDVWSIRVATSAQFASNTLLLSQQYFLGSAGFGPGFYTGDNGFSGTAELRFDQETNWAMLRGYQIYGFVDGGSVWDVEGGRASLASAGAGTRFFLTEQLQAGISIGVPIHNSFESNVKDFRILFSVLNAFKMCPNSERIPQCS